MTFTPKDWRDRSDTSTPISAAALEDMERRLSAYTDSAVGSVESAVVAQGPFTATTAATALASSPVGTKLYETSGAPAADGSNIVNEWVKANA